MQKKKPTKAPVKRARKKTADANQPKQNPIKRLLFGEEKPDLSELEAGSTTILDILSPTAIDTKSRDYILVDGVYHAYLYVTGYGYSTTVGSSWLAPLVEAGEGISLSFTVKRQSKEKILSKISQTTMVNRSRMRDVGDNRQDFEELDSAINSGLYLKDVMNRQGEDFYYTPLVVNSFYIIDDEKQRSKMTEEFYAAVKKEIAEYQERADYFIKSGSQSPAVMERWVLKIQALEQKKKHYEGVLRRELDGLDDEFATLKFMAQELQVRAKNIRGRKAA